MRKLLSPVQRVHQWKMRNLPLAKSNYWYPVLSLLRILWWNRLFLGQWAPMTAEGRWWSPLGTTVLPFIKVYPEEGCTLNHLHLMATAVLSDLLTAGCPKISSVRWVHNAVCWCGARVQCVCLAVSLPVCLLVPVSQWMINPPSILVEAAQRHFSFVLLLTTNCTGRRCDAAAAISLPKTACIGQYTIQGCDQPCWASAFAGNPRSGLHIEFVQVIIICTTLLPSL